ncbi:expressed unknown protein [Seminavis robusta]|uniref:Uncharacterized protein n=1 Tax=Seminavis robusta TaxID=568900 RepID=A0A9N8D747_9STRA|nr:expressed unknown protein [Seminavis robusta]|eukprot:Sro25_g016760.1 n/a (192) ;mRNA; f:28073-28648
MVQLKSLIIATFVTASSGFSLLDSKAPQPTTTAGTDRRSLLLGGAAALISAATVTAANPQPANAALGAGTPVGREIGTFNSLIDNLKNIDLGGGLDASKLNEPSVPFSEFGEKLKNGEVAFVEFMAPSGDVAYATFKGKKDKEERIRIGQGYPISKKGSWSSPDYVIRAVSNFGVPYKFTVPALAKYNKKK